MTHNNQKANETLPTFTAEMVRTMTKKEVVDYWLALQRQRRDQGLAHYKKLVDPATDQVVAKA